MNMYEVVRPLRQADAAGSSAEGPALHNQHHHPAAVRPLIGYPDPVDAVLPPWHFLPPSARFMTEQDEELWDEWNHLLVVLWRLE